MNSPKRAVIDIGSNAIRFVAYGGPPRAPMPIYNEKLPVSFGKSVMKTGSISQDAMEQALAGLIRFKLLADYLEIKTRRVVATASVRDAANGEDFIKQAAKSGILVDRISGGQEALAAGLGVLCDMPWAEGYVCDLGGGSLELVRVSDGKLGAHVSLPLGTMRIAGKADIAKTLRTHLSVSDDLPIETGLNLYLVGGAWRAMARVDQHLLDAPLAVIGNHEVQQDRLPILVEASRIVEHIKALRIIPAQRADTLHDASRLGLGLANIFQPEQIFTSACGIREGLLFDILSRAEAKQDPLLACTRWEGKRLSRFDFDGDRLADWMAPLFDGESGELARLRRAACYLADTSWNIHPDYRASHAMQLGLHGNWLGIDHAGRVLLARALFAAHGGKEPNWPEFGQMATPDELATAIRWGLSIRLAMRLDAGTGAALMASSLEIDDYRCILNLPPDLDPESVERRIKVLATAFDRKAEIRSF